MNILATALMLAAWTPFANGLHSASDLKILDLTSLSGNEVEIVTNYTFSGYCRQSLAPRLEDIIWLSEAYRERVSISRGTLYDDPNYDVSWEIDGGHMAWVWGDAAISGIIGDIDSQYTTYHLNPSASISFSTNIVFSGSRVDRRNALAEYAPSSALDAFILSHGGYDSEDEEYGGDWDCTGKPLMLDLIELGFDTLRKMKRTIHSCLDSYHLTETRDGIEGAYPTAECTERWYYSEYPTNPSFTKEIVRTNTFSRLRFNKTAWAEVYKRWDDDWHSDTSTYTPVYEGEFQERVYENDSATVPFYMSYGNSTWLDIDGDGSPAFSQINAALMVEYYYKETISDCVRGEDYHHDRIVTNLVNDTASAYTLVPVTISFVGWGSVHTNGNGVVYRDAWWKTPDINGDTLIANAASVFGCEVPSMTISFPASPTYTPSDEWTRDQYRSGEYYSPGTATSQHYIDVDANVYGWIGWAEPTFIYNVPADN